MTCQIDGAADFIVAIVHLVSLFINNTNGWSWKKITGKKKQISDVNVSGDFRICVLFSKDIDVNDGNFFISYIIAIFDW